MCRGLATPPHSPESPKATYIPSGRPIIGVVAVAPNHEVRGKPEEATAPARESEGQFTQRLHAQARLLGLRNVTRTRPTRTYRVKNQLKKLMLSFFFFSGSLGGGVLSSSLSLSSSLPPSGGGGGGGDPPSVEQAAAETHLSESLPVAAS